MNLLWFDSSFFITVHSEESKGYRRLFTKHQMWWTTLKIHVPTYFLRGSLRVIPPAFIAVRNDWTCERAKLNRWAWSRWRLGYQCPNSCWCCMNSQRLSGMSRVLPCTPSWWCLPAGIDVPAPRQQLDTPPHTSWKRAPSSLPTPWLNRRAPGQRNCRRTLVPSHAAGCEKTPTWGDARQNWKRQKKPSVRKNNTATGGRAGLHPSPIIRD